MPVAVLHVNSSALHQDSLQLPCLRCHKITQNNYTPQLMSVIMHISLWGGCCELQRDICSSHAHGGHKSQHALT